MPKGIFSLSTTSDTATAGTHGDRPEHHRHLVLLDQLAGQLGRGRRVPGVVDDDVLDRKPPLTPPAALTFFTPSSKPFGSALPVATGRARVLDADLHGGGRLLLLFTRDRGVAARARCQSNDGQDAREGEKGAAEPWGEPPDPGTVSATPRRR